MEEHGEILYGIATNDLSQPQDLGVTVTDDNALLQQNVLLISNKIIILSSRG